MAIGFGDLITGPLAPVAPMAKAPIFVVCLKIFTYNIKYLKNLSAALQAVN